MFRKPNYTQTPNEFFDDIAKTLKEGELRVLLVIMRQTFGWGNKEWDRISLSQMEYKTGMCRDAVVNAVKSLVAKKLVIKHKDGEGQNAPCWYSLMVEEPVEFSNSSDDSNNSYRSSKTTSKVVVLDDIQKKDSQKKTKEKNKKKEPLARPITLNESTKQLEGITDEDIKNWQEAHPAVNVRKELLEARIWALSTPRKNYRRSIDTWMRNKNESHTTPFKTQNKAIEEGEPEPAQNAALAISWEKDYQGKGGVHYDVQASANRVNFIMPNNESYSVDYQKSNKEFLKLCQKAISRMNLTLSPSM